MCLIILNFLFPHEQKKRFEHLGIFLCVKFILHGIRLPQFLAYFHKIINMKSFYVRLVSNERKTFFFYNNFLLIYLRHFILNGQCHISGKQKFHSTDMKDLFILKKFNNINLSKKVKEFINDFSVFLLKLLYFWIITSILRKSHLSLFYTYDKLLKLFIFP